MGERSYTAAEIREACARLISRGLLDYLQGDEAGMAPDGQPAVGADDGPAPLEIKRVFGTVAGDEYFNVLGPDGQPVNDRFLSRAEAEALAAAPRPA